MQTPAEDLRWDDVRVLLALTREGSLKRAAHALGVNISTVSRRLDALEAAVGAHLFDRSVDGTRPTAAAEQLLPFAESMEQAAHALHRTVEGFEVEPEGIVRITAPPGLVDHFLAPALTELVTTYPRLRISIISSIGYADLTRREADLALRLVRPAAGDLVAKRLTSPPFVAVAAPAYTKELGRLAKPEAARWVTWEEDLAHLPDAQWIAQHLPADRVVLRTSSMTAQIEAVRTGIGAMLAPAPYADLRGLTQLETTRALGGSINAIPRGSLWLVGHRALREVPRIAAVWTWLESRLTL